MQRPQQVLETVTAAGIPCRLECRDEALARSLGHRYAAFRSGAVPRLSVRVDVGEPPEDEPGPGPFAVISGTATALRIEGHGFHGEFDERAGRGWIIQPRDPAPLEMFLTAICAGLLLREGGVLLHAAALIGSEGARVFFGPSGAGKTTVAELVGAGVITDETTAIRRVGGRYRVFGVPWRGSPLTADLAGLFHLRKGGTTSFTPLSPAAAVRRLLGSVLFSRADDAEIARFLEIGGDLLKAVTCWDMQFTPDRTFWSACPAPAEGAA